jgi:hypothetical protein
MEQRPRSSLRQTAQLYHKHWETQAYYGTQHRNLLHVEIKPEQPLFHHR